MEYLLDPSAAFEAMHPSAHLSAFSSMMFDRTSILSDTYVFLQFEEFASCAQ